jgi:transposase-like protein
LAKSWRAEPGPVERRNEVATAKSLYAGFRFPAEVISQTVWPYFRFPLSLHRVEEMLAARSLVVSHETIRQWALKFSPPA